MKPLKVFSLVFLILILFSATSFARVSEEYKINQKRCLSGGGNWVLLPTVCGDKCRKPGEDPVCAQTITWACECGKGMCWDDKSCVKIVTIVEEKGSAGEVEIIK